MIHHQNDACPITTLRDGYHILVQELAELETESTEHIVLPVVHRLADQSPGSVRTTSKALPFCYIVLTGGERHDITKIYEKVCIRYSQHSRAGEFQPEFRAIASKDRSITPNGT